MKYALWQDQILYEIQQQLLAESAVARRMHGVRFVSRSKGRGRNTPPRLVTLVHYSGRWRLWSGEDRHDGLPWDTMATEILGANADGAMLREEFERLITGGRF